MEHKVLVYSTATCPSCKAAKQYLTDKGITYTSLDVGADEKAREEMIKKNGGLLTVPTIEIDGKIIVGFDQAKINAALTS